MKKFILLTTFASLFVGSAFIGSAFGMQSDSLEKSSEISYLQEIRLLISDYIFRIASEKNAILAFRSWCATDTKAWNFFKKNGSATTEFLKQLHNLSYRNYFDLRLLNQLTPLLAPPMVDAFEKGISEAQSLINLFTTCAEENCWKKALEKINSLKKDSTTCYCMSNYYWETTYRKAFPCRKTLLIHALELQAPIEVIDELTSCGSLVTRLTQSTPAPCLIVCEAMIELDRKIEWNREYTERRSKSHPDLPVSEEIMNPTWEQLDRIMTLLLSKGASLQDSFHGVSSGFFTHIEHATPLLYAVRDKNLKLVEYLKGKGAEVDFYSFSEGIIDPIRVDEKIRSDDILFSIFTTVLGMQGDRYRFLHYLAIFIEGPETEKKEMLFNLFKELLETTDSSILTSTRDGLTVLDRVFHTTTDTDILALLEEKGAVKSSRLENVKPLHEFLTKLSTAFDLSRSQEEEIERQVKPLLKEALEFLATPLLNEGMPLLLYFTCAAPLEWDETKALLYALATHKSLYIDYPGYGEVRSFFHYIVGCIDEIKSQNLEDDAYAFALTHYSPLITWLAQQGIADDQRIEGKTAAEKAFALGMPDLAECITQALQNASAANAQNSHSCNSSD